MRALEERKEDGEVEKTEPIPPPVYVTQRYKHYPMLHIRPAQVEDNDDLLPIIHHYSPQHLSDLYGNHLKYCIVSYINYIIIHLARTAGDYFIAELIESQDKDHKTIVAEVRIRRIMLIFLLFLDSL